MCKDLNTRIIDLTVGELLELIKREDQPSVTKDYSAKEKYVYGLNGLAKLLGCSKVHAGRIKRSGKLDEAIRQDGRLIVIEADKAIELFGRALK